MSKHKIMSVELSKKTVAPGEQFTIRVEVSTWDWVKKAYATWATLKSKVGKWGDLFGN